MVSETSECVEDAPGVADIHIAIRSTGTGNQVEQGTQVILADLMFTVDDGGNVVEIKVRNWRQDR